MEIVDCNNELFVYVVFPIQDGRDSNSQTVKRKLLFGELPRYAVLRMRILCITYYTKYKLQHPLLSEKRNTGNEQTNKNPLDGC